MKEVGELRVFTHAELAELMGVNIRTVKSYLKSGKLQGCKFGRYSYVTEESVQDLLRGKPIEKFNQCPA